MLHALIAGAGPAGSTAALLLARAGKRVRICEPSAFPRTKTCGEYLSAGSVRLLRDLGAAPRLAAHARDIRGVRLHGHGVHVRVDFPQAGWSLPRSVLDAALLDMALEAGAELVHARVEDCTDGPFFAAAALRLADGTRVDERAQAVIGADGLHSLVARKCGFARPHSGSGRFALGGHYSGFSRLDGYIDMFLDGRTYAAINPLSDTSANVMLVVEERELQQHRGNVERFAEDRARALAGDLLAGAALVSKRIAVGPLAYRAQRIAGERVLLVGDAAAFIDPFTGQGVYLAMRCARIAAHCVIEDTLQRYGILAGREIEGRDRAARRVSQIVGSAAAARTAAAALRLQPRLFGALVGRVTGAA